MESLQVNYLNLGRKDASSKPVKDGLNLQYIIENNFWITSIYIFIFMKQRSKEMFEKMEPLQRKQMLMCYPWISFYLKRQVFSSGRTHK